MQSPPVTSAKFRVAVVQWEGAAMCQEGFRGPGGDTGRISGALEGVRGKRWKVLWAGQLNFSVYCLPDIQAISSHLGP